MDGRALIGGFMAVLLAAAPAARLQASALACDSPAFDAAALREAYAGPADTWPEPCVDPGVPWRELSALPSRPPDPGSNPWTPAKAELGQALFHDPQLSGSGQIACASCHDRDLGWADGRRASFGHDRARTRRHAPSVRFAAWAGSLFWDGRAESLEAQALIPVFDPIEMALTPEQVPERLAALSGTHAALVEAAFGDAALDLVRVSQALAAFQRGLARPLGRFQAFLGGRRDALDDRALRGLHLFRTRAGCMNCHSGPTLSDDRFHNLGLHFYGTPRQDLGRFEITGHMDDRGAFRTPSLLGVSRTAPYMHGGYFGHLRGVLSMYNQGMVQAPPPRFRDDPDYPPVSRLLRPLSLTPQDIADLESFLESL